MSPKAFSGSDESATESANAPTPHRGRSREAWYRCCQEAMPWAEFPQRKLHGWYRLRNLLMTLHFDMTEVFPKMLRVRAETIALWNQQMYPQGDIRTYLCIPKVVSERFQHGNPRGGIQHFAIERNFDIHPTSSATRYPDVSRSQGFDNAIIVQRRTPPRWEFDIHIWRYF